MRSLPTSSAVLAIALAASLGGCATEARPPGLYADEVTYLLRWDRSHVDVLPEGGLALTNDLGFEVRLDRGYLVQDSATLVDCEGVGGDVWDSAAALLRAAFLPAIARAGHGELDDPSAVIRPTVLDLVGADADARFGAVPFPEARYCRLHFLVTGVYDPATLEDAPPDLDLVLMTLYLEGAARGIGEEAWAPFEVRSTLADGVIVDLPDVLEGTTEGSAALVVIERDLGAMFDGVDFASPDLSDDAIARSVLHRLDHDARVSVRVDERSLLDGTGDME